MNAVEIVSEMVTERKSWIRRMREIVKDNLKKHMSTTQYATMKDLWNVGEVGKVNRLKIADLIWRWL